MFYAGLLTGIVIGMVIGFFTCALIVMAKDSDERTTEIYDRAKFTKTEEEYYTKEFLN